MTELEMLLRRRGMPGGGLELGSLPIGPYTAPTILRLKESGAEQDYILLKHDYEASGRSLVMRRFLWETGVPRHSGGSVVYAGSTIDAWCTGTFYSVLSAYVRAQIQNVDVPYMASNGAPVTSLSRPVFLQSGTEANQTDEYGAMGTPIPFFSADAARIARRGSAADAWWLRSQRSAGSYAAAINVVGFIAAASVTVASGARPCFTLPAGLALRMRDGSYCVRGE